MDMYKKREMRKNKIKNDNQDVFHKTSINWYPGHMTKTKKEILNDLKLIDVVIEILDSRIPISSQNPDIAEITKNKKKIIALNKTDLADEKQNTLWVKYFEKQGIRAILTDSNQGKGMQEVIKEIEKAMKEEMEKLNIKGRTGKKIRVMILGIPNVGKSSFINRIVKTKKLEVGNKPGVTRKKQWISINDKIDLLDTPGVLWPKFESEQVALNLAYTGSIKDDVLEQTEIAYQLLKFLLNNYRENIVKRYNITNEYIDNILSQEQPENFNIYEIMLEIGKKRGAIISGGAVDEEKTAKIIIDDFRKGELGRITIERR